MILNGRGEIVEDVSQKVRRLTEPHSGSIWPNDDRLVVMDDAQHQHLKSQFLAFL